MPAYVIVEISITDPVRYERYKELAPPSIAIYGGRYIARGGKTTALEGDCKPERLVILEFPTAMHANDWWSSPEYAEAKVLRHSCATSRMLLVEGLPAS